MKRKKGFTLIELLIVIGIISILAAIIFVAVDPARRLGEARNAERWSSVNAILNGILKYTVDNSGILPATATAIDSDAATFQIIGEGGVACAAVDACVVSGLTLATSNCFASGLDTDLVDEYLPSIPFDSLTGDTNDTRYYVNRSAAGRITVGACDEETTGGSTPTVSVSR